MTTTRGRKRDPLKDESILQATRDLLVEVGYAGLSMEAVAARAGVSKPTLYLRYPGKVPLVFEAVFGRTKSREVPDSGSVVADLHEAYQWAVEEFAAPEARAAVPGLLAELAASPELAELVRRAVIDPSTPGCAPPSSVARRAARSATTSTWSWSSTRSPALRWPGSPCSTTPWTGRTACGWWTSWSKDWRPASLE